MLQDKLQANRHACQSVLKPIKPKPRKLKLERVSPLRMNRSIDDIVEDRILLNRAEDIRRLRERELDEELTRRKIKEKVKEELQIR